MCSICHSHALCACVRACVLACVRVCVCVCKCVCVRGAAQRLACWTRNLTCRTLLAADSSADSVAMKSFQFFSVKKEKEKKIWCPDLFNACLSCSGIIIFDSVACHSNDCHWTLQVLLSPRSAFSFFWQDIFRKILKTDDFFFSAVGPQMFGWKHK